MVAVVVVGDCWWALLVVGSVAWCTGDGVVILYIIYMLYSDDDKVVCMII